MFKNVWKKVQKVQVLQAQAVLQAQVVLMVLPLLAAGLIAGGSALSGVYSVGKAVENRRYWSEYYKNTHRSPRYRWRSGYYDYLNASGSAMRSAGFSYGYLKKI